MDYRRGFETPNRTLPFFLVVSLLIAVGSFAAAWGLEMPKAAPFLLWMQAAWVALFIVSIFRLRRRALWLLIGLPFVLFWLPAILLFGCSWGPYACV
jgi:hypothetical protein